MHDQSARTLHRLQVLVTERLKNALYSASALLDVTAWEVPDEPVPFAEAVEQTYVPISVGDPWGRPWGTTWLHLTGAVPADWVVDERHAVELVVDLGFGRQMPGFQCEGTAWTPDGRIIKGIEPLNDWVVVPEGPIDLYVEAASNPTIPEGTSWISPTPRGDKATAGSDPLYRLAAVDVRLRDLEVWRLTMDLWTLLGLYEELPETSTRRAQLLACFDDALAAIDPADVAGTAVAGREALRPALEARASDPVHTVHAMGHAHIDSAWLWPTRETRRKCARTFSNVLDLMDRDPDFTFACSSAQQYAWIQEDYPELFARIQERVTEGRFVPAGGMWVESDTNLPGAEALVRQFVEGTSYFISELGVEPQEVWLPDSFGYTAAMPQIAVAAGKSAFLTQKISWNDTNRFPHHSFDWEGIDGTRILTHFPPSDTYNSLISGAELARSERQLSEKGRSDIAMLLFGYGDGGGGPTREMLAAASRTRDLAGSPRVRLSTPQTFFDELRTDYPDRPVWTGEMYLEYHRGTYTSQHRTKAGNRRSENLLHEAELWAATAAVRTGAAYPADALRRLWRAVLLNQFHDILPGTGIAWVAQDAERDYEAITAELEGLIADAVAALAGEGDEELEFNAAPVARAGVAALGAGAATAYAPVDVAAEGDDWVLRDDRLRVVVDAKGEITSIRDLVADREVVPPGMVAGRLHLYTDVPNEWDAWDINHFYTDREVVLEAAAVSTVAGGVCVVRGTADSRIEQTIRVEGGVLRLDFTVDWHERQKLLKLDLPVDVHTSEAVSEIQFGHLRRPIHQNTSWDVARFETVAQRWVQVGEAGYGVAVANCATYGYGISRIEREGGGTATLIQPSLLRAPVFPDPEADQGRHELSFVVVPGAGVGEAVRAGYGLNLPPRRVRGGGAVAPLVIVDDERVVIETVKLAEDGSGDVVVRLYESRGGRAAAVLTADFEHTSVEATDLLERPVEHGGVVAEDGGVRVELRPFELVTLRFSR